mmetsp:Transcript_31759/g.45151  ORF Transcript_31759/g.45151 Transcript_31759/m.45151 type:complete len:357 (-) Transcript_31759:122-1192(-)
MKTGWSKRTYKQDDKEFNEHRVSTPSVASTHLERHHFAPSSPPLVSTTSQPSNQEEKKEEGRKQVPDHIQTVWDYQSTYGGELYTVRFESSMLIELCSSVEDLAMDAVYSSTQQALKLTVFATLITAAAIPVALLRAANMIDSSWTIAIERADEAGRELAKSLLFSQAGRRPVSLVGFSMGARTIYCCLKELAKYQDIWEEIRDREAQGIKVSFKANSPYQGLEKMREPASILEDVIVMGMPQHLSTRSWHASRQMIAGRFVNCYSRKDMILTLMFRYKRLKFKSVCGTCAVDVPGVENIDVSDLITAHAQYCYKIGEILKRVRHGQATRGPGDTIVVDAKLDEDMMPDLGVDKTW